MHVLEGQRPGHGGWVLGAFQGQGVAAPGKGGSRGPPTNIPCPGAIAPCSVWRFYRRQTRSKGCPQTAAAGTGCRLELRAPWQPAHLGWVSWRWRTVTWWHAPARTAHSPCVCNKLPHGFLPTLTSWASEGKADHVKSFRIQHPAGNTTDNSKNAKQLFKPCVYFFKSSWKHCDFPGSWIS